MNSGSFAMDPVSQDGVLVTIALVIVAVLAVLTVLAMVIGARNKAKRVAAEAEEEARLADLRERGVEATNTAEGVGGVVAPPSGAAASSRTATPPAAPQAAPTPAAPQAAPTPAAPQAAPTPAAEPIAAPGDAPRDEAPAAPTLADEPIAAAAPLDASPASVAADAPADTPGAGAISQLKGLGPKIQARLAELGITRVDQLAWLDDAEAQALDAQLGAFQGRMERDRWREQARLLAQGDRAEFEATFGKLG